MLTTITLRDGRTLEYADVGESAGTPVLFLHGTPATGGQAAVVAEAARAHGVRLVAPSRPGYGASTITPPGLATAAADLLELADLLGLDRVAVLGTSGGGPFALAVAALAGERVTLAAVHAGPGEYLDVAPELRQEPEGRAAALLADGDVDGAIRLLTTSADAELGELRGLSDAGLAEAMRRMAPPGETWLDRHPAARAAFDADFRRAVATSDGYVRDNLSWCGPWDVDLAAITAPVRLVYGDTDAMVPQDHGDWLRSRLPHGELHVVPGGHGDATFGAAADTFRALTT